MLYISICSPSGNIYSLYIYDSIYAIKRQIKNERRRQNLSEKNIKLVIVEKPSGAQAITKEISVDKKREDDTFATYNI